ALGQKFVEFVETQMAFYASPAGDMKLWFGGDERVGDVWDRSVGAAYRFQKETNGKLVPEMSPWRFNVATNYLFDRGILKGASLGGAFRWQDGQILGYALKPDFSNLDVNKPYWGESESALDLWVGYERKLTQRIRWRIQLNLRNVGDSVSLVPISVQPDGTPALQRIREGQTWTLTNTFSF
ncbi:MAG TPA: TonB-dependent receptor, partial [Opitutus sp.]|nr:TonB-dependent receptor [Opitutus sp.]